MANVKISELPLGTSVPVASLFPVVVSGVTQRITASTLLPVSNIKQYGTLGTADDSSVIQTAIDTVNASGGGILQVPPGNYYCNVILKQGVFLVGGAGFGYLPSSVSSVSFTAAGAGVVIDTPSGSTLSCGVIGINVSGLGSGTSVTGIRFRNVTYGVIKEVGLNNLANEGILVSAGVACTIEDVLATNCVLNRSRSAKIGAVDVDGSDHFLNRIEATISASGLSDANAYLCAVVIRGDNMFIDNVIGEISDEGIHLVSGASYNRFSSCRADLNFGNGWNINSSSNQFSNCLSLNNSQATNNTYSNWQASSTSGNNLFTGCYSDSTLSNKAKYGFEDLVASASTKNQYVAPFSSGAVTAQYSVNTNNGSSMSFPIGGQKTLTVDSTTPDVTGYCLFQTANLNPTTYTDFLGGVPGQAIKIFTGDANSTIQHNGLTISTSTSANITMTSGKIYEPVKFGSIWRVNA